MRIVLGALIWLMGGNIVCMIHYRRVGRSIWSGFRMRRPPTFSEFNLLEWVLLALFSVVALALMTQDLSGTRI